MQDGLTEDDAYYGHEREGEHGTQEDRQRVSVLSGQRYDGKLGLVAQLGKEEQAESGGEEFPVQGGPPYCSSGAGPHAEAWGAGFADDATGGAPQHHSLTTLVS